MSSIDEFAIPNTILRHFDLSSTPWTQFTSPEIEGKRRKLPGSKLFFDRLLELVGLDGHSLYPPNTPANLRRLLHSIHSLELDRLKKDCFYYYLLKDYDESINQPSMEIDVSSEEDDLAVISKIPNENVKGKSQEFARRRCMPLMWKRFMDGYWALDHALWENAIASLSDPAITTLNFVPSIIQTLSSHVSPPSQALSLIHNFLVSAHPELTTQEENDVRLIALASTGSIPQAFSLIRASGSESERRRSRENLWLWILGSPRIPCGLVKSGEKHQVQTKSLKELLHIPLSFEENTHLIEFLTHPPSRSISSTALSLLHDLITLRLIHQGQYSESLLLDKQLAGTGGNEKDRQKRREMVREFISILPEAQRLALSLDVEQKKDEIQVNGNVNSEDTDMGSSWIKVNSDGPSYADIASEPPSIPTPAILPSAPTGSITSTPAATAHPSSYPDIALVPTPIAAPTPIRPSTTHTSLFSAAQNAPLPASPAKPSSPFSGPPRFAAGSSTQVPSPRRVLSGSPFNLPQLSASTSKIQSKGSPAPVRKLPKTIINDDDEEDDEERSISGRRNTSRKSIGRRELGRGVSMSVEPQGEAELEKENQGMDIEENRSEQTVASSSKRQTNNEPPKSTRKPRKAVSNTGRNSTPPRESAKSTEPVTPGINGMPGSFMQAQSKDSQDMPPPSTIPRNTRANSNVPESVKGRSRITRSASRAILDEDHDEDSKPGPPSKKTRSTRKPPRSSLAPSEITDDGSVTNSVRRSTRSISRASTVQPSEQGSPTPSMSSVGGRKSTRGSRAGSATPRMSTRVSKRA